NSPASTVPLRGSLKASIGSLPASSGLPVNGDCGPIWSQSEDKSSAGVTHGRTKAICWSSQPWRPHIQLCLALRSICSRLQFQQAHHFAFAYLQPQTTQCFCLRGAFRIGDKRWVSAWKSV